MASVTGDVFHILLVPDKVCPSIGKTYVLVCGSPVTILLTKIGVHAKEKRVNKSVEGISESVRG